MKTALLSSRLLVTAYQYKLYQYSSILSNQHKISNSRAGMKVRPGMEQSTESSEILLTEIVMHTHGSSLANKRSKQLSTTPISTLSKL